MREKESDIQRTPIWNDVAGYEGIYQVSIFGDVINCQTGLFLKPHWHKKTGYATVELCRGGKDHKRLTVHRLVATAFIPNPGKLPQVNHIDGDKRVNRAINLEWTNASGNATHAYKMCLRKSGEKHVFSKLTEPQVRDIRRRLADGERGNAIAKVYGVLPTTICEIKKGRSWRFSA